MWRGISRYPKGVPKSVRRNAHDMLKLCQRNAQHMLKIHRRYTQDILRYVNNARKIFPIYAQDIPKVSRRYAQDFKNMNDLLTHYVSNMDPKDASASKKVRLLFGQQKESPLLTASALFLETLARQNPGNL